MSFLRLPGQLWHLVVLAMVCVAAPLAGLLFFASSALLQQSATARLQSEVAVALAEITRAAAEALTDLERSAGQFRILGEQVQKELVLANTAALAEALINMAEGLEEASLLDLQQSILNRVLRLSAEIQTGSADSPEVTSEIDAIEQTRAELAALTAGMRRTTEQALQRQTERAARTSEKIVAFGLATIPLTLGIILLFTVLITRPLAQLQQSVKRLGREDPESVTVKVPDGPGEIIRLGQQIEWLRTRLVKANHQQKQFLQNISHELKTPLASIREGTGLLRDGVVGPISPAQKEVLQLVEENGLHLQQLISNLLQLTRAQRDADNSAREFELLTLFAQILHYHGLSMAQHGIRACVGGPECRLLLNEALLNTVLDNLVSNAIAYGRAGGILWFGWHIDSGHVYIDVGNSGQAIAESERDAIFQPFFQGQQRRQGAVKGSGVGLSVARQCARQLPGGDLQLHVSSRPGNWFRVTLDRSVLLD